ncbi:MAG TPA: transglutaminase-like domain-containing protein, partial [Candidatus Limnocylindrales bacterium]|nr:transglutaminase-like domain-containing protein [Candidatus Limnocylindrales bacterium]
MSVPEWLVRYARPREGWLALALLFVMLLSLGWSIQRADWIPLLEFLIPVAFYAAVSGALLGLTRLSVTAVLPISAIAGTAIVLWAVGGEYYPDLGQIGRQLAMRSEVIEWVRIIVDRGYGPQLVPYAIGLGGIMWVTAFIAAYTIYRHHRVLDAILLVGAALIANMSATFADLFFYLVLFMLAALLLWLRAALIGREEGWQRRRVNENAEVPAAVMRSGVLFIAGSIMLAWVLTSVAVAAPLTAVWNNLDGVWSDVRDRLDGVFGGLANPDARISGATFGPGFRISGSWQSSDQPVLTVASLRGYYLRTATYETYTGHGFVRGPVEERRVEGGDPIFSSETPEQPLNPDAYEIETVHIQYQRGQAAIFTPGYPVRVLAPAVVLETGGLPVLGGLESPNTISSSEAYYVTALISKATQAQLNSAGTNYPQVIVDNYLGTDGVTDRTRLEARRIVDDAGAGTPFEMAQALARYLNSDTSFRYAVSAPLPDSADRDFVDFFLFDPNGRIGYCEYYATTMAVLARTLGIPSRVAVGYTPGTRVDAPGGRDAGDQSFYQVREENAHAWAEIYFPGYGWERFESTMTIDPIVRPRGAPVGPVPGRSPGAIPGQSLSPDDFGNISSLPSTQPVPNGFRPGEQGPPIETRGVNLLLISAIVLAVIGVAAWRLRRSRRRLRFLAPGERQWFRLALAADRAGVAQRPNETIYEYAGWLEEQIPRHSPEIR